MSKRAKEQQAVMEEEQGMATSNLPSESRDTPPAVDTLEPLAKSIPECLFDGRLPAWPDGPFSIIWPWGDEQDPQVGQVVGWNWERKEVAVVTDQPTIQCSRPWRVVIDIRPMPKAWMLFGEATTQARVFNIPAGLQIDSPLWYTSWNRAGVRRVHNALDQALNLSGVYPREDPFGGPCLVFAAGYDWDRG